MSDKTGNHEWDDFKEEQAAIEREMDELDERITEVETHIQKGDED
jgi:predicted  nucleic acid-binding Zn-ribbon protein